MDCAIRVRRAIMQYVNRRAFARLANTLVDSHPLPALEPFRLVLWQVRLHGGVGFRKIEGLLKLERGSHFYSGSRVVILHYKQSLQKVVCCTGSPGTFASPALQKFARNLTNPYKAWVTM